jgi:hypothetical protein
MEWIHANLLWFVPLAAVPLVLHLLTLHRLKTVELSTFRFLFDSYIQQRRRMKFVEALLAMLRTLFLLLLVVVCARPVVRHWGALFGGGSGRDVVLVVDASASMNARTEGVSAIERARRACHAVVESLGPQDRVTLVRAAARPVELCTRFSARAEAMGPLIDGLTPGAAHGNLYAAFLHLFDPRGPARKNATVYVFTDGQAAGWKELAAQGVERLVPENVHLRIVNVGSSRALENRGVVGTAPRPHRVVAGLPVVLRPLVVNDSPTETAQIDLRVVVEEKDVARRTLAVKAGATEQHEIVYLPTEPGVLRCRFEIPEDRFPDDDQFLFTLHVEPQIRVLLVNGGPATDPYEDECLYLRTALTCRPESARFEGAAVGAAGAAGGSSAAGTGAEQAAAAGEGVAALGGGTAEAATQPLLRSLDLREVPESGLSPQELASASVVILANCGGLNETHFGWLRQFVAEGGGLLIFPGERVNPQLYAQQFFAVPGPQRERLVPVEWEAPVGDAERYETFAQLASIDLAHPALSVFADPEARYLTTARFYRRFPIKVQAQRGRCWVLAAFAPGEPALIECPYRDGLVMLAAFAANARWSNLPLRPEFVPLVLRLVHHLQHRPEFELPGVVPADGALEVRVAAHWHPATGRVIDGAGRSQDLTFQRTGRRLAAASQRLETKGYYQVEVHGGRVEEPREGRAAFAVNLAPEESAFAAATPEQIRSWLPDVRHLSIVDATAEAQQAYGSIGEGREVWRWLLALVFLVIAVEFLLATAGGRRADHGEEPPVGERIRRFNPRAWLGGLTGADLTP